MPPTGILVEIASATAVSAAVLLVTWPWRERGWPVPVALGLGFAASHAAARGFPGLRPVDTTDYRFHFALLGALLGTVEATVRIPLAARWAGRAIVAAGCAWLLFHRVDSALRIATVAAGFLAAWSALEWRAARVEGAGMPAALVVTASLGSFALLEARTASGAQLAGALAAATGPLILYALLRPRLVLARGGVAAFSLVALPLWLVAARFDKLPLESAALLAVAPLAAQRRRWLGALVALATAAFAVYLAHAANLVGRGANV